MPYPVGMQTRVVSFAKLLGTGGAPVRGKVRVSAARGFIWEATNEAFLMESIPVDLVAGAASIELPIPGQAGFVDGAGNTISDWTYTAVFTLARGFDVPEITFDLPNGAGVYELTPDLSRTIYGGTVTVPFPVQGEQGPPGPPGPSAVDADATTKGILKLAGDLGGTADLPTVPGLAGKAPLASPTFTGTPAAPTAAPGTNTTQLANTAFVQAAIAALIASAPGVLDTLDELAAALGDDPNFATTITNALAGKAPLAHTHAAADIVSGSIDPLRLPTANELSPGVMELATTAEAQALTSIGVAMTPGRVADAASSAATALRLMRRDAAGRAQVADPAVAADIATKGYADALAAALIAKSLLTAKGSLIAASAAGTPVEVPAGTNGYRLTADSAAAGGVSWQPAGGGGSAFIIPKSGSRIAPATRANAAGSTPFASGSVYGMPFYIGAPMSIDALAARVSTLEAGMTFKILLYSSDADGHPVTLVADSGSLSAAATGAVEGVITPVALAAGLYWAFIRSNGGTTVRFQAGTTTLLGPPVSGAASLNSNGAGLSADVGTFASPTATLTAWSYGDSTGTLTPYITLRRA